jgi:DNA excision repair protein ERCC-2
MDFCSRCGSLLLWNFDGGRRVRRCPRCGRLDEDAPVATQDAPKRIPQVKKGVSPKGSTYARRAVSKEMTEVSDTGPSEGMTLLPIPLGMPFPFEAVRPGQLDFMNDSSASMEGGKFLLAKVPTGIGKTAAALSAAVAFARKSAKAVFFLTSKQSQHAIAVKTLRMLSERCGIRFRVVDFLSKQSMCPRDISSFPRFTFNHLCKLQQKDGTCPYYRPAPENLKRTILDSILDANEIRDVASSQRICPHRAALESARDADVVICDFNYLFSDLRDGILKGMNRELDNVIIIVDEGHNLPDRIRSNLSSELYIRSLEDLEPALTKEKMLRPYTRDLFSFLRSEAKRSLEGKNEFALDRRAFVSNVRGVFRAGLDQEFEPEDYLDAIEKIAMEKGLSEDDEDPMIWFVEFMRGLLQVKDSHLLYFSCEKGITDARLIYRNLDPSEISAPVFRRCHSALIMSGTLSPPSMFGDVLGMAKDRRIEKEYPSPFPAENRLMLVDETVTTAYNSRGSEMYERIAHRIAEAANATPGNTAAFFPSYSLMEMINDSIVGLEKDIIVEDRETSGSRKASVIDDLERANRKGGTLLLGVMGGSLSEGLDYRDNLLRTVIVVGLPLAPPTIDVIALRDYSKRKWGPLRGDEYAYDYPAVNRMLQAAGRSIRSETDRSVVLLLDRRYIEPRYLKFIPLEMRPRPVRSGIGPAVREFHSRSRGSPPRGT